MNFTAIDFETANAARSSACSVGLVIVRNGEVVDRFYSLIRPPTDEFNSFNVRRHRIRPEMVASAPRFADVYPLLLDRIHGPVIAHNASFDISVLRACLNEYDIAPPTLDYYCSLRLSEAYWPDASSYQLKALTKHLGIPLANHHNAQEDADACAQLVLQALQAEDLATVNLLASQLGVTKGRLAPDGYAPCRGIRRHRSPGNEISGEDDLPTIQSSRLSGEVALFTGLLDSMPREQAEQRVRAMGGETVRNMSDRVTILVVGHEPGAKLSQAESRRRAGQQITILDETAFHTLLKRLAHEE